MGLAASEHAELFELLELLRERRITRAQLRQLEALVLGNTEAMDAYVRYMAVAASLRQRLQGLRTLPPIGEHDSAIIEPVAATRPSASRRWKRWALAATVVAASVALAWMLLPSSPSRANREVFGSIELLQGQSLIISDDQSGRPATVGANVYAGDTLESRETLGRAVLVRDDGTRLTLVGATSITCDPDRAGRVVVHAGVVAAAIRPQPADRPFELVTSQGIAQVLGTQLVLEAMPHQTELTVSEGRVRFTRSKDGRSVEVPQGKRVVEGPHADLEVRPIQATADRWQADFEAGLPDGWKLGQAVREDLPTGSRGAVASMGDPRSGDPSQGIVTNHDWTRGLFQVHKDSCLTLTYKLERPGWVQVFLGTRQADLASASGANVYLLEPWEAAAGERWWDIPAGTWYTARIPLARFFKVSDRNSGITPGDVGFGLTFSSQEHDRGLVIDRISIEPTGPQSVEIEALKQ